MQELGIEGCTTLTLLSAASLGRLTKLLLHNCPLLQLKGGSALTNLRVLGLRQSPLAAPLALAALPALSQLRSLDLQVRLAGI